MRAWSLLCVLLLAACAPVAAPGADLDREVRLSPGESVTLDGGGLTVALREVPSDSRCPVGAQCPWAGEAVVVLELTRPGREAAVVALRTPGPDQSSFGLHGYRVELLGLEPLPRAGEPRTDPYVARLRVTRH